MEDFDKDEYTAAEKFMTAKRANGLSLFILLPFYIIGTAVYLLRYDYANIFATIFKATFLLEIFILAIGVFLILAAALLAKAAVTAAFLGNGLDGVKFKIIGETQKPYCAPISPIKVGHYRTALAMYIIIMGIAPYIGAFLTGDFIFILASFVCAYFAGVDALMLIYLSREKKDSYITDFDGIMLYRIYEKKEEQKYKEGEK